MGPGMKILSLLPSATEIVYALGLEDQLVGVTCECDFPPEARAKPVMSRTVLPADGDAPPAEIDRLVAEQVAEGEPLYTIDSDAVARTQPDLILAQDLCRVCAVPSGQVEDALAVIGCRADVLSLDPSTLDDILDGITEVGRRAGREAHADELVAGLRARAAAVEAATRRLARPRTLTLEWLDPPFVGGHWVPEMVERAGGLVLAAEAGQPSRRVSWDEVAAARPEVIVFIPCGYGLAQAMEQGRELLVVPQVATSPAGRTGRVLAADASSYFSRPGPRVISGLEALAWALHPDALPPPPPGTMAVVGG
jgi:iron complex transport system substrate-binding protein